MDICYLSINYYTCRVTSITDFLFSMESRPKTKGCEVESCDLETIEELLNENSQLKAELTSCYQKVAKSQKVSLFDFYSILF